MGEGKLKTLAIRALVLAAVGGVAGCGTDPSPPPIDPANANGTQYLIGAGDSLNIFVWRNPELTLTVPVRPDGMISTPLVEDIKAEGKTPTQLARDVEERLKKFVRDPIVTVIASGFVGDYDQQVRVVGEAADPRAIPFRIDMTLLDVVIAAGGLTKYAAGDRAIIVRRINGEEQSFPLKLNQLVKYGDIRFNYKIQPGDVIIIPQSIF
jgi:polysaccharide export outer membrane protein